MRAIKSGLGTIITIGLVSGSALGVAAQDEAAAPVEVSGTVYCGSPVAYGTTESHEVTIGDATMRVVSERGNSWGPNAGVMSDARLQGDYTISFDSDAYYPPGMVGSVDVGAGTWRIVNDEGAWQGSYHILGGAPVVVPLIGEGGYEGLTAIVESVFDGDACSWDWRGLIFEGEAPSYPEPPAE